MNILKLKEEARMWMPEGFQKRLFPVLPQIVKRFGTPFHIYDETGIIETCELLKDEFEAETGNFNNYFAVKALPNPEIMKIIRHCGFGFDCSSVPELELCDRIGVSGHDIMFTSNNTARREFEEALKRRVIMNLDDLSLVAKIPEMPRLICFRYNPGPRRTGNAIIGNPEEAKYGVAHHQLFEAYIEARKRGAKRFGLHTMICSNERNYEYMVETVRMLLRIAEGLHEWLGIKLEFINMGGGLGIPYAPDHQPLNLGQMSLCIIDLMNDFSRRHDFMPKLLMESGRYITGPHGVLVTTAINRKNIYRKYIGVDACMSALMRPALYDAHHGVHVLGQHGGVKQGVEEVYDIVGSLCENNDKFAKQRPLPRIEEGDLVVFENTGAHGWAMGFNYNGRLRPQELLLERGGQVRMIRRTETSPDYFATLSGGEVGVRFKANSRLRAKKKGKE